MPVKIVPSISPPSPLPGAVRHQFVLILDKEFVEKGKKDNPNFVSQVLTEHFGLMSLLVEQVMSGDFYGWHVWYDFAEGEFELDEETGGNPSQTA